MKKHPFLLKAEKMLKSQKLHTKFLHENLLTVALDNKEKDFAFLVIEPEQFPGIVVSFALDFFNVHLVSEMIINLIYIAPLAKGELFYRSNSGNLYWEDDAYEYFNLEHNPSILENINPITQSRH